MKQPKDNSLLDRVVLILEQARTNVVRAVNSNMETSESFMRPILIALKKKLPIG